MKIQTLLFILLILFIYSCKNHTESTKNTILNKTWVVDSFVNPLSSSFGATVPLIYYAFQFKENGNIDMLSGDDYFLRYKVNQDTVFIEDSNLINVFRAYKLLKIDNFTYMLESIVDYDPSGIQGTNRHIYLTDVTKLESGEMTSEGENYDNLKNTKWYPTKITTLGFLGKSDNIREFDDMYPLKQNVLEIGKSSLKNFVSGSVSIPYAIKGKYMYVKTTSKEMPYRIYEVSFPINKLTLKDQIKYEEFELRRVGSNEKVYEELEIPKNIRYACNYSKALQAFKEYAQFYIEDADYFVDYDGIQGKEASSSDCIYHFKATKYMRGATYANMTYIFELTFTSKTQYEVRMIG